MQAVTGAFGFTGKYIANRLLSSEEKIRTFTNSPYRPNPFGRKVEVYPYNFQQPEKLIRSLQGIKVLYNTYWVRFNHKNFTFDQALENSKALFSSAAEAGVERIVHISITNNSLDSPLPYFKGKARLEEELKSTGISYAILRPALLFGREDILINNIAWALRKFPFFLVFGDGNYRLQPIYVDDLAKLAVEHGHIEENKIINAIGPQTYTFRELVAQIARAIGKSRPMLRVQPHLGHLLTSLIGLIMGDVLLTKDEIKGLMAELLYVDSPPMGKTKLSKWVRIHARTLGTDYRSELKRRLDRSSPYSGY